MGDYIGRTQAGKVYACLRNYFDQVPVGMAFKLSKVAEPLLERYNILFPNDGVNQTTGLEDGIRTLASIPDSPIQRIDHGEYRLVRKFELKRDGNIFSKHYFKKAAKGKKYKKMKGREEMNKQNKTDDVTNLTKLGSHKTKYEYYEPNSDLLETFQNQYPHRNYETEFVFKEFTSLCPKTGQPDFATISVKYCANEKCIETKSLKLYFLSFRQYGSFMETITNKILEDLVEVCSPRAMTVTANFNARGGTLINVVATYVGNEKGEGDEAY